MRQLRLFMVKNTALGLQFSLCIAVFIGCTNHRHSAILRDAAESMGGADRVANVDFLYTQAECTGPRGEFLTRIWSSRRGLVRFEQTSPRRNILAGINSAGGWQLQNDTVVTIDQPTEMFLKGHELHMIALDPTSRFGMPTFSGKRNFGQQESFVLQFIDKKGNPVSLFYDSASHRPLGMEVRNSNSPVQETIRVEFTKWEMVKNGLELFFEASFYQGEAVYRYQYTNVQVNSFGDSVFEPAWNQKAE